MCGPRGVDLRGGRPTVRRKTDWVRYVFPWVAYCLLAADTRAAACRTQPGCTASAPCSWNSPATWTCGRVPSSETSDTCTISPGTVVVLRSNGLDCGTTTIDGTWVFDPTPSGRDADG